VCDARAGAHAKFELDLPQGLLVRGHDDRLDHVIGHLVQNALDATAGDAVVRVRLFRDDAFVVLEVTDSGAGMSPEFVRDRLFKPFETSKPTGMGIGVYESAQYVASLGGQILYDSTPGVGTCVRVRLPAGDGTVPATRAKATA